MCMMLCAQVCSRPSMSDQYGVHWCPLHNIAVSFRLPQPDPDFQSDENDVDDDEANDESDPSVSPGRMVRDRISATESVIHTRKQTHKHALLHKPA